MRNSVKRWIGALLAACLVMALLPTAALAADTGKAIQLGASNINGYDSTNGYDYIYYGKWNSSPIKWRVLDTKTNMANATEGDGLFLLSDVLLGTGDYGGVYFGSTRPYSNAWQGSDAQDWCETFYNDSLTTQEQSAVLETTKSDGAFTSSTYRFAASENILNGDKVFFLSAEEAENSAYGFTDDNARIANYGNSAGAWWLRSPFADIPYSSNYAGVVFSNGRVFNNIVFNDFAARPAFNLNRNSVLFTSAAVGGKIPAASSGGNQGAVGADAIFEIVDNTGNEWKLTLLDSSRNFVVSDSHWSGNTLTFSYSGAQTGTNEYISVIIEENGEITYYGRILQLSDTTTGPSGKASLSLPIGVTLSDTTELYVFNEQYNGDKLTDYASALSPIPAPAAEQPPVITTTTLQGGKVGEAYSQTLAATGTAPITWSIDSGSLPAGLSLYGDTISGTPTTAGTFTFTVKATNSAGNATKDLTIVIQAASVGPNPDPNPNPNPNPNYNQRPVIIIPTTDQNVSASVGNTVTMRITANYAQSYQWYVDTGSGFKAIPGATGAAYTTSQVALGNNGYRYYCVARNAYGTAVSPVFTLNVLEYMGIPATGDSPQAGLWIGFAMVSFAGLAACAAPWRRKRTN